MNGKAKIDFEYWVKENYGFDDIMTWNYIQKTVLNALIIEWLDTVRIYIISCIIPNEFRFYCNITHGDFYLIDQTDIYSTRQEATEKAIETAVNTYNNK